METIELNGHMMTVDIRPGGDTAILMVNGWGVSLGTFDALADALEGHTLIRFDPPGIGDSPLPLMPVRVPEIADAAAELLDHYGFDKVDVLGYSWGGTVAQALAHQHPHRVRKLILMATSPGHLMVPAKPAIGFAFLHPGWAFNLLRPQRYFTREFLCKVGPQLFGGRMRDNPLSILPHLRKLNKPTARGMIWQVLGAVGWTSLPWLHQLRQPTLLMGGSDDPVINPINLKLMHRLIPNSRLEWIQGGGHLFPVLEPHLTARLIEQFLEQGEKVLPFPGRFRRKKPSRRAG